MNEIPPWELDQFQREPVGSSDLWDETMRTSMGWIVRVHRKPRVQPFHPLHRSTPVAQQGLGSDRVTVVFQHGKKVGVVQDKWQDPASSKVLKDHVGRWRGFTFFKVQSDQGNEAVVESDGSYERIGEDDESW